MKFKLFLSALSLAPAIAVAQSTTLEIVTVTGYPASLEQVLASAEIVSREEIERWPAQDIGDLLRFRTGLELGRNGGPGQAASIFIRGTESDHTLVLIDGVPINSASIGAAAIQNIDTQNVDRIEIVKGPVVETILGAAEARDADMIAMPTAGHKSFVDALKGSTSERVLRHAPCPVLSIRAPS